MNPDLKIVDHGDGTWLVVDDRNPDKPVVLASLVKLFDKWKVHEVFGEDNKW